MTWTWLGICAAVFLIIAAWNGFRRGFIREVVSTLLVLLTFALVWFINPYVNEFLRGNTPVYEKIQTTCEKLVETETSGNLIFDRSQQDGIIQNLGLPEFLTKGLEENNTIETYQYLAVESFKDYVAGYLARALFNGLSFLFSYLLATILIRVLVYALDIIARLPILKGANKLAGALLGAIKGVIFIWILCLVLTVLCNTSIGKTGLQLIEQDTFLNALNTQNIFVKIFMNIF